MKQSITVKTTYCDTCDDGERKLCLRDVVTHRAYEGSQQRVCLVCIQAAFQVAEEMDEEPAPASKSPLSPELQRDVKAALERVQRGLL